MSKDKAARWFKSFIIKGIRENLTDFGEQIDVKTAEEIADKIIQEADLLGGVVPCLKKDVCHMGVVGDGNL